MISFKLKQTGPTPRHIRKHLRRILKIAWTRIARTWHRKMRPMHFTSKAARRYGYARRSRKYNEKKQKRFGHTDPLVYTGASRARTRVARIAATSKGNRIRMNAPTLNLRPKGGRTNLRKELLKATTPEAETLAKQFAETMEKRLANIKDKSTG